MTLFWGDFPVQQTSSSSMHPRAMVVEVFLAEDIFPFKIHAVQKAVFFGRKIKFEDVKIAYRELLSAVIAFLCFAPHSPSSLVRINTDNQNVVS